jgi:hypothetical protein
MDSSDARLQKLGRAARERTLDEHTSRHRARQLIQYLEELRSTSKSRSTAPTMRT